MIAVGVALLGMALGMNAGWAADADNGKTLHDARCLGCHQPDSYTRAERKVDSLEKLKTQVAFCNGAVKTGEPWFDDGEADVTEYLNKEFYKFQ
jgi:mono/diheme cytochrome c family protein